MRATCMRSDMQAPRFETNLLRARRLEASGIRMSIEIDDAYLEANNKIKSLAAKYEKEHFVSWDKLEIFADAPFFGRW